MGGFFECCLVVRLGGGSFSGSVLAEPRVKARKSQCTNWIRIATMTMIKDEAGDDDDDDLMESFLSSLMKSLIEEK